MSRHMHEFVGVNCSFSTKTVEFVKAFVENTLGHPCKACPYWLTCSCPLKEERRIHNYHSQTDRRKEETSCH